MRIWFKNKTFNSFWFIFSSSKGIIIAISCFYIALGFFHGRWRTEKIIIWDVISYYEYLTAAFMFNDLSFEFAENLPEKFDGDIWLQTGPNGEKFPKTTMGTAIMYSPFYMAPFLINKLEVLGSYGYSSFFQFFIFLAALFYFTAALVVLRKVLKRYFDERTIVATLLAISIGTGLTYYTTVESGMSHTYSFFLFSCLLLYTIKWHEQPKRKNAFMLGLILGLIVLIRPTNAIVAIVPILFSINDKASFRAKWRLIRTHYGQVILSVLVFAFIVFLQPAFWKYSTGSWFVLSYGDEGFFWTDPKFLKGLFGFRKGLFIYYPILIFGALGFFLKSEKLRNFRWGIVLFMILNAYVILSWWSWWFGGSYGHRAFIDAIPLFALFMSLTFERIMQFKAKTIKWGIYGIVFFFLFLNQFQTNQYAKGFLHWDGMTWSAYKTLFLKNYTPDNYWEEIVQPDYEAAKRGER